MNGKRRKFKTKLTSFERIGVDSMCFIYHFEQHKTYSPLSKLLFSLMEEGKFTIIASELVFAEIIAKASVIKDKELVATYENLLNNWPNLSLISPDFEIYKQAALFRAEYQLRLPDAVHLATVFLKRAEAFVTNDEKFRKIKEIPALILEDFV